MENDIDTGPLNYGQYTTLIVLGGCTALLSAVGSWSILWMTGKKLMPRGEVCHLYYRLMFGLSFGDAIFSTFFLLSPFLAPSSTGWPWAVGNTATCTASGFMTGLGTLVVAFYHCFLSLHFVLRIRYQWKSNEIMQRLEMPAHLIAWVISLLMSIVSLIAKSYNPFIYLCTIVVYPNGCTGNPDVDCERGESLGLFDLDWSVSGIISWSFSGVLIILALIGFSATYLVYRSVRAQMRKNRRHSFLRFVTESDEETSTGEFGPRRGGWAECLRKMFRQQAVPGQQRIAEVGVQCILYSVAYFNNFFWPLVLNVLYLSDGTKQVTPLLFAVQIMVSLFFPLQGFWNLIIFLRPRWTSWRTAEPEWSRWKILKTTFSSQRAPRLVRRQHSSDELISSPFGSRGSSGRTSRASRPLQTRRATFDSAELSKRMRSDVGRNLLKKQVDRSTDFVIPETPPSNAEVDEEQNITSDPEETGFDC